MEVNELDFVGQIISNITGDPLCFDLHRSLDERGVFILANVDSDQLGRVIGKKGNTANAIRELLRALGLKNSARYSLKIEARE